MNTGAEAVETAIKVARKWGYQVKGVAPGQANIIVAEGNFHGRTTTIVSFSTDPDAHDDFGPYTPGFKIVPYGAAARSARRSTRTPSPCCWSRSRASRACVVPPDGYLPSVRRALHRARTCSSSPTRSSRVWAAPVTTFACDHESVVPDMYLLGKALGGGIVPVSAVAANEDVLGVIRPGQHGSTFGGNPLACAVATEVVGCSATGEFQRAPAELGGGHARAACAA